jgi:hypothetical protein
MVNSLNIDFRDGALKILAVRNGSTIHAGLIRNFPPDADPSAVGMFSAELVKAGLKKVRGNIILPSNIVHYKIFQIPLLNTVDTLKVIQRELALDMPGKPFVFGTREIHRSRNAGPGIQEVLTEFVLQEDALRFLAIADAAGVKNGIMTSGLEGNLRLFKRMRPESEEYEAIIDIGQTFIEIALISGGRLMNYTKLILSISEDDRRSGETGASVQTDKIRTYKIIDTLYNSIIASRSDASETRPSHLWLCGLGAFTEGLTDSVADGLGIRTSLLTPDIPGVDTCAFTALSGISDLSRRDEYVDLFPEDVYHAKGSNMKTVAVWALLVFYVLALAWGYRALSNTESTLEQVLKEAETSLLQQSDTVGRSDTDVTARRISAKLLSNNPTLYPLFRDLAQLVPDGVILNNLALVRRGTATSADISATIRFNDENFKNSVLSTFLRSLNSSAVLKQSAPPLITTSRSSGEEKEIAVKVSYEVVK